jgi:hypothetical protein
MTALIIHLQEELMDLSLDVLPIYYHHQVDSYAKGVNDVCFSPHYLNEYLVLAGVAALGKKTFMPSINDFSNFYCENKTVSEDLLTSVLPNLNSKDSSWDVSGVISKVINDNYDVLKQAAASSLMAFGFLLGFKNFSGVENRFAIWQCVAVATSVLNSYVGNYLFADEYADSKHAEYIKNVAVRAFAVGGAANLGEIIAYNMGAEKPGIQHRIIANAIMPIFSSSYSYLVSKINSFIQQDANVKPLNLEADLSYQKEFHFNNTLNRSLKEAAKIPIEMLYSDWDDDLKIYTTSMTSEFSVELIKKVGIPLYHGVKVEIYKEISSSFLCSSSKAVAKTIFKQFLSSTDVVAVLATISRYSTSFYLENNKQEDVKTITADEG